MKPKVIVTHWVHAETIARLESVAEVVANPTRETWPRAEVERQASHAAALMAFMPDTVDAAFLRLCPKLRIIACALKGFDNFDVAACRSAGVAVSIVPDLLTEPTAELAIGLAIGLARNIGAGNALVRSGAFKGWRPVLYGTGLAGATVAIIGLGAVGRAIAARVLPFGARVIAVDPATASEEGIEIVSLGQALAAADLVILAAPLTPETRHLIHAETLAAMKPGARLVNIGRGSTVDESAVADALEMGQLAGYAADVFAFEDWALQGRPAAIDQRLLDHPATLFTPHLGSAVDAVRQAISLRAADNIVDCLEGRTPRDAIA